jgi:hypothetical protein
MVLQLFTLTQTSEPLRAILQEPLQPLREIINMSTTGVHASSTPLLFDGHSLQNTAFVPTSPDIKLFSIDSDSARDLILESPYLMLGAMPSSSTARSSDQTTAATSEFSSFLHMPVTTTEDILVADSLQYGIELAIREQHPEHQQQLIDGVPTLQTDSISTALPTHQQATVHKATEESFLRTHTPERLTEGAHTITALKTNKVMQQTDLSSTTLMCLCMLYAHKYRCSIACVSLVDNSYELMKRRSKLIVCVAS